MSDESHRGRIAFIALYPDRDRAPLQGVSWYARSLARALRASDVSVEVWAERSPDIPAHLEDDEGIQVFRTWRKGLWAGYDLWRALRTRQPAVLHMQVEYFIFGGSLGFASVIAFLAAARLAAQKVVVTIHHVIGLDDVTEEMLREFGLRLSVRIARGLLRLSTALLSKLAHRVIVPEEVFHQRLVRQHGLDPARVSTIPFGIDSVSERQPEPSATGRILFFGYLKWYKGIDIVLRGFREVAREFPDWKLVIAGGVPPGLDEDHPHKRFLSELRRLADPVSSQVEFIGYVDDPAIPSVFQQADIVVFPYRVLFASSGPLVLAAGFRKPFVLSQALRPLLPTWPLWCRNFPADWAKMIQTVMRDGMLRARVVGLVEDLASTRAWPLVAARTAAVYREVDSLNKVPHRSS